MNLPDIRDSTTAYVHKDGRRAATLTRTDRGTEFMYERDYLDRALVPVATTLPLTEEPVVSPGRSVPAFFAGLLPEGRRLTAIRRHLKVSADDDLSLLLAVGEDPVGDVSITPTCDLPITPASRAGEHAFGDILFADLVADHGVSDPSALAGVQDKVSGRMITVPLRHDGGVHLLKLTPPELPKLVENEAFFLRYAARLPIPVVEWEVVTDKSGAAGLLVTRFDRVSGPDGLQRLPVEDATQLLRLYPGDKYSIRTEDFTDAIAASCASRPLAIRSVFVQVVWAWLSGNGDLHGKNVSVLGRFSSHGGMVQPEMTVAPMYDIPSTVPYRDHELALPVRGTREGVTRLRLLEFAEDAGLPERAARTALDAAVTVAVQMLDDIRDGGSPWRGKARDDLVRALEFRVRQAEA
jgi:serine/threonine-protein kinase HipA